MKRVILAYFSPTHTTEKIVKAVAKGMEIDEIVDYNLTLPSDREIEIVDGDIVILAGPVYIGRLPRIAKERLSKVSGSGQTAICLAVYGNRTYGDTIIELADIARRGNLITVAGAAFIGEHSYSTKEQEMSHGRPDEDDLALANDFGKKVKKMLKKVSDEKADFLEADLPGILPSDLAPIIPPMASIASIGCNRCGICIGVCPLEAINESLMCDPSLCIKCFACVKSCPQGARELVSPINEEFAEYLAGLEAKKPEFFGL